MNLIQERRAGVCMHISSLPGPYGIGSIGRHARWFIDQIQHMGLRVWQILPIGPTGYGNSPYQSLSVFAGNTLLIDLDNLVEQGLLRADELAQVPATPADAVAFEPVIDLRRRLLQRAAERFVSRADPGRQRAYQSFLAQHDKLWLHDFALYRAIKRRHHEAPWHEWEPSLAARDPAALDDFANSFATTLTAIKITQFLFFEQWATLRAYAGTRGIQLIGDVPIYVALDSADTWSHRELFELNAHGRPTRVGGVPPDYFSADGQLWGNPLYRWSHHDDTGYAWWIDRMRHACALTDLVRIDHFRGFEAYWSIPAQDDTARGGRWEPGPREAIFDALREALGTLPIIAEDLGVITDAVDALRKRYQLPGMAVLQFLLADPDFDLASIETDRLCYTGTHDNDTTVSWFAGGDHRTAQQIQDTQARVLALIDEPAERVHLGMIRLAMASPACLSIAPMQDFLGLPTYARFNTPGVPTGNWLWRLQSGQLDGDLLAQYRAMTAAAGRIPED